MRLIPRLKAATVMLSLGLSLAVGGDAGAAGDKGSSNVEVNKLVEMTRNALQERDVLNNVVYYAYNHDVKIGEAVKGPYTIQPEQIIPWSSAQDRAVSVVRVKATRGNKEKVYTFAFVFSKKGLDTHLLYPGSSNTDPALFSDVFAPAKGFAQGVLGSKEVNIKETTILGEPTPTGWKEEWLWVNEKGKTYSMKITFSTGAPGSGTVWHIDGLSL